MTSEIAARAACAWCGDPIPESVRRDAICCSKRCRQARHRFLRAVGTAQAAAQPLRLAYADPPYPGRSARYYRDHPDFAGEVDHADLIASLATYDGWALSTSADALRDVLPLCPADVRVAAWHRGERPHRTARGPLSAWEPVIYFGGRPAVTAEVSPQVLGDTSRVASHDASRPDEDDASPQFLRDTSSPGQRDASTDVPCDRSAPSVTRRIDSLIYSGRARTTDPGRVIGTKPAAFCRWVFDLLGAQAGDELVDLFPGSGGVARAWTAFAGYS